jgi:hypothetical protein
MNLITFIVICIEGFELCIYFKITRTLLVTEYKQLMPDVAPWGFF